MSGALPPFLAPLGIDDAQYLEERALRRAYARQLKQFDIEAEPERFQALRGALDQALQWIALRDRARAAAQALADAPGAGDAAAPTSRPAARASEPKPAALGAQHIAAAVFAAFHRRVAAVFADASAAREALTEALWDPALLNIDARTLFEGDVARLLANGWQPGHEHLLDPAIEAFGWETDHARLAHFGQVGGLLGAAIRDRVAFQAFDDAQKVVLARLLARIRAPEAPDPKQLQEEVQQLQFLVQRVPNWLRIVSPVGPVNQRFEMWRNSPASAAPPPPPMPRIQPPKALARDKTPMFGVLFALVAIVSLLRAVGGASTSAPLPQSSLPTLSDAATVAATDADLARRQQQAEALLASIVAKRAPQAAQPTPGPARHAAAAGPLAPSLAPLDQPWWTPDWEKNPASRQPDPTLRQVLGLPR